MHKSVATLDSPEFINLQPLDINPLMSKCEIKVLYTGNNRNRSSISKEVAAEMSKTLRGAPIVGYYKENKEDFGDHGGKVTIDDEGVELLQELYNQNPSVCLQLERLSRTNRQNLMSASGLDNELYNKLTQKLTQGLFIQYEGYDIIPTQRFRQGMSMINRDGNIHRVGEQDA